ncbi:MAG: hypothetical protein KF763_16140 [Cyclobacteriaceae bacterium]|jgi:hypothetical protein|nr:hypothetical protein [Cyclobacteriaceae bacterium]MBX2896976.1 hypothetical protein [Cyclobacteriaceae bacterium]
MTTDFIKVRAHLNTGLKFDSSGNFAQDFRNSLYEQDENFRSKVIVPINESVGLHNWAIDFIEFPGDGFLADIFTDSQQNFNKIKSIIQDRIPDIKFEFFFKGTVSDYLA